MTPKTIFRIQLAIIIILGVVLAVSFTRVNNNINTAGGQLNASRTKLAELENNKQTLISARNDVNKYKDIAQIAKAVVPEDKNQALAVREIVNIANKNGISLGAITFPASNLGSAQSTFGSTNTSKKDALSQLKQVSNVPGVYELLINVESDSTKPIAYDKFISFLGDLEKNRRTAQVNSISITPTSGNSNQITFIISLNEYIKP